MNLFTLSLLLFILLQYIAQAQVICDEKDDPECKRKTLTDSTFICSEERSCQSSNLNCVENRNCTISCSGMFACDGATINAPVNGTLSLDCFGTGGSGHCLFARIHCKNGECIIKCDSREACHGIRVYSQPDTTKIDITASGDLVLADAYIHCPSSSIGGANEDNCNIVINQKKYKNDLAIENLVIFAVESFNDFNLICNYQTSPIPECYDSSRPTVRCGSNLNQECQMELKPGSNHEWQCVNADNICNDYIVTAPPSNAPTSETTTTTTSTATTTNAPECDATGIGNTCYTDDNCFQPCQRCCKGRKICEWRPQFNPAAQEVGGMIDKNVINDKDTPYNYYGYIVLVGVIAFILVNTVFIGCWCLRKGGGEYKKVDMVANEI